MKRKMKIMIDPRTFNPYKFESFLEEVGKLGLAKFENGELIFEYENSEKVQEIMDKHMLHIKK